MLSDLKESFTHERFDRWALSILLLGSIIALAGSLVLSVESIELAKNSDAALSCNFSAVLNCATVANHPSAQAFGFPNSFIGLMTIPVMITIAVAGLMGARLPRPFMFGAQLGVIAGALFATWMFYMSYIIIGVLCPWCLAVDAAMLIILFAVTRYNIQHGNLYLSDHTQATAERFVAKGYDIVALISVVMLIVAAILLKYGSEIVSL